MIETIICVRCEYEEAHPGGGPGNNFYAVQNQAADPDYICSDCALAVAECPCCGDLVDEEDIHPVRIRDFWCAECVMLCLEGGCRVLAQRADWERLRRSSRTRPSATPVTPAELSEVYEILRQTAIRTLNADPPPPVFPTRV